MTITECFPTDTTTDEVWSDLAAGEASLATTFKPIMVPKATSRPVRTFGYSVSPLDMTPIERITQATPIAHDDPKQFSYEARDCFRVNRYGR
jgi:hypothetical protein